MQKMQNPFLRSNLFSPTNSFATWKSYLGDNEEFPSKYSKDYMQKNKKKIDNPFFRKNLFSHSENCENFMDCSISYTTSSVKIEKP